MAPSKTFAIFCSSILLLACSGTVTGTSSNDGQNNPTETGGSSSPATDPEVDALFGPPSTTTATADSLVGIWAPNGSSSLGDLRLKVTASTITFARRCGSSTGWVTVAARVGETSVTILETKNASGTCSASLTTGETKRCTSNDYVTGYGYQKCYLLSGTKLDVYPGFVSGSWIKLSD